MTWRLAVVHETTYEYESEVIASFNEVRMTPSSGAGQLLVHHRTSVQPSVAMYSYRDYWGTTVEAFDLHTPHDRLTVVSDNVVESWAAPRRDESPSWSTWETSQVHDQFVEHLRHTSLAPELPDAADVLDDLRRATTPLVAAEGCVDLVRQRMTYTPGATHVHTPADEAWANRHGVCQDYSHVTISLLRSLGVPARYVSGYHYTGSGEIDEPVLVESHAWLEAWVGEWIPFDPTNGKDVGERYVTVAVGRDYNDVSPMRGIFSGGASRAIDVTVTMTRQSR